MTRYVFIDNPSGFVWGDADGDTPEQAALALDAELGVEPSSYEPVARFSFSNEDGYLVYEAGDFDLNSIGGGDGQSEKLIEAVTALPYVCALKRRLDKDAA